MPYVYVYVCICIYVCICFIHVYLHCFHIMPIVNNDAMDAYIFLS